MSYHRGGQSGSVAVSYSTSPMAPHSPSRRYSSGSTTSSSTTTSGVGGGGGGVNSGGGGGSSSTSGVTSSSGNSSSSKPRCSFIRDSTHPSSFASPPSPSVSSIRPSYVSDCRRSSYSQSGRSVSSSYGSDTTGISGGVYSTLANGISSTGSSGRYTSSTSSSYLSSSTASLRDRTLESSSTLLRDVNADIIIGRCYSPLYTSSIDRHSSQRGFHRWKQQQHSNPGTTNVGSNFSELIGGEEREGKKRSGSIRPESSLSSSSSSSSSSSAITGVGFWPRSSKGRPPIGNSTVLTTATGHARAHSATSSVEVTIASHRADVEDVDDDDNDDDNEENNRNFNDDNDEINDEDENETNNERDNDDVVNDDVVNDDNEDNEDDESENRDYNDETTKRCDDDADNNRINRHHHHHFHHHHLQHHQTAQQQHHLTLNGNSSNNKQRISSSVSPKIEWNVATTITTTIRPLLTENSNGIDGGVGGGGGGGDGGVVGDVGGVGGVGDGGAAASGAAAGLIGVINNFDLLTNLATANNPINNITTEYLSNDNDEQNGQHKSSIELDDFEIDDNEVIIRGINNEEIASTQPVNTYRRNAIVSTGNNDILDELSTKSISPVNPFDIEDNDFEVRTLYTVLQNDLSGRNSDDHSDDPSVPSTSNRQERHFSGIERNTTTPSSSANGLISSPTRTTTTPNTRQQNLYRTGNEQFVSVVLIITKLSIHSSLWINLLWRKSIVEPLATQKRISTYVRTTSFVGNTISFNTIIFPLEVNFEEGSPTNRPVRNLFQAHRDEKCGLNGLRNIGNTCFMNSVIQCLSNTRPLLEYVMNEHYIADINTTTSSMKGALIKAFSQVIHELWQVDCDHAVNTTALKSQIQRFTPRFMGYSQQDAQEFLRYLLEGLHEDVNRVTIKPQPIHTDIPDMYTESEKAAESWKRYLRSEDSMVVDLFVGQLRSSLRCTFCDHVSVTLDPFWDLSLPIPSRSGTVRLSQCLEHFTREEVLDGDEKPTCSKCQMRRKCTKSFSIQKFPKILVIHLKRFSPMERFRGKLNVMVDFPLMDLDLSAFAAPRVQGCTYNLYGVANHSGTTYSGHYTAYCKHPYSGEWHEYNDSHVSEIPAKLVVSSEAYVLFYEQQPHSSHL
ncbi:hypothetical protein M0804_013611 [Polistes exclamans]|nr:hypothetical protein M0804_013611 [Polistes exclamans]